METNTTDITQNELTVQNVNLTDLHEGVVTFKSASGKDIDALFWGHQFKPKEKMWVKFSSLDYPLEWDVIFSENKDKTKAIIKDSEECSYLGYGQIVSINPVVADFGDITMELGSWTNDNNVIGEYIYWKIDRLDVLEVKNST